MQLPSITMLTLLPGQDSDNSVREQAQDAAQEAKEQFEPIREWLSSVGLARLTDVVRGAIAIAIILVAAVLLRWLVKRLIQRLVKRIVNAPMPAAPGYRKGGQRSLEAYQRIVGERRDQRANTIGQVIGSIATIVIFGIGLVMSLSRLGVNITPILASAGIIGVAVGFGAQSVVSDFLSGIFMLMEDQYGVGDWIDVGEASGEVEHVGLRVTQLRDADGVLWFVRNGEVVRIGNHSQDWARAVLDVPVGYGEDLEAASQLLKETAWTLWEDEQFKYVVLDEPEIWGVEVLSKEAIVIRLAVKTAPLEQWGVARELRVRIKDAFDRSGIQIPMQQQTVWMHADPATVGAGGTAGADADGRSSSVTTNYRGE